MRLHSLCGQPVPVLSVIMRYLDNGLNYILQLLVSCQAVALDDLFRSLPTELFYSILCSALLKYSIDISVVLHCHMMQCVLS